ncbi:rhodanese-related sulfurtransferase [Lysinibacillus parviboronicapiens]|uniref:Rhodanese-related sulfurtransferase n=1 Tax=Lysinibacillus parviboronicapiens TaxID=436516 RepID=A0ABV2PDM5_9BACI
MKVLLIGVVGIVLARIFYIRLVPVKQVKVIPYRQVDEAHQIFDVRDYNTAGCLVYDSKHIPYGYLPRFYREIENRPIHLLVESQMDLNMASRFLRKKGYSVNSYTMMKKTV